METENQRLRRQIDAAQAQINRLSRPRDNAEMNDISRAFMRADAVAQQFGERAMQALPGESTLAYRRRLAANFKRHSPQFKDADLTFVDEHTLRGVEETVYRDAAAAANDPANYAPGEMRAIKFRDPAGRECTKWVGDASVWRSHFDTGAQIGRIRRPEELRAMGRLHHR